MRHRRAGKKLGRNPGHRKAVLRNLVTSLFRHGEISTTHAKAKVLRPIAEKMITLAKRGDLHARRQALSYMRDKSVTHKLFDQMGGRFSDRQGGYVRILKTGHRIGDNAALAIVQLLLAHEGLSSRMTTKRGQGAKKAPTEVAGRKTKTKGKTRASEDKQVKVEKP